MTRPVVAFFGDTLSAGTPRGAFRLFRGLAGELARREDIELICLGRYLSDPNDPVGCTYECVDGRAYIHQLESHANTSSPPPRPEMPTVVEYEVQARHVDAVAGARAIYRKWVPLPIQMLLRPLLRQALGRLRRSQVSWVAAIRSFAARSARGLPEGFFRTASSDQQVFDNTQIVGNVVSLNRVDVLLNFWWFHIPFPNPLVGRYRHRNLRIVSWFLDAIPLRVAHWQPGMIPVQEFRARVQFHLEMADEIVAISRSAAADIGLFFPHISKPIHFVPCGIFDADFVEPHGAEYLTTNLGIDLAAPFFVFIGFQEPSKNVLFGIRALVTVSRRIGREVQALVVGYSEGMNLSQTFGPIANELPGHVRVVSGGMISDTAKRIALSHATALIYPSRWEGFGIPPLEAMAAGTPSVVGDIAPLREICIDLAEYCDPYDVDDIAAAIVRTMQMTSQQRADYAARAREHARPYSWRAAVAKLLASVLTDTPGQTQDIAQLHSASLPQSTTHALNHADARVLPHAQA